MEHYHLLKNTGFELLKDEMDAHAMFETEDTRRCRIISYDVYDS